MAKVLGISGFENSIPFKKAHWPGLDEREYRISQGHDSAAVLIVDGEVIAGAEEERFSRKKHTGDFPSTRFAIASTCRHRDRGIDEIAHAFDYTPYRAVFSLDVRRPNSMKRYSRAKFCSPKCIASSRFRWSKGLPMSTITLRMRPARHTPRNRTNA